MLLIKTLRETSNDCGTIKRFGYGDKYFRDHQGNIKKLTASADFPICWVHSVICTSSTWDRNMNHVRNYQVLGCMGKPIAKGFAASQEEIEDALSTCWTCVNEFEQRLQYHPAVDPELDITFRLEHTIHDGGLNLFGWIFSFPIRIIESVPVNCDAVPTSSEYVNVGFVTDGYTEDV